MKSKILMISVLVSFLGTASAVEARRNPPTPPPVNLTASNWTFISHGMGDHPTALASGSGWYFDFPVYNGLMSDCNTDYDNPCPSVNYVTVPYSASVGGKSLTVTLQVSTTGTPTFNYQTEPSNTCNTPATVRPIIVRKRDRGGEYYRWWSNPVSYTLAEGSVTLTVPLTPDKWSSVFGKFGNYDSTSLKGFNEAMANVGAVGLTFGGGCFFGHGVNVGGGTAQFTLTGYSFN